ncbi:MAG: hypothetical protein J7L14_03485, partial [Candidatus Diapherotrites archaeon]|nr:hypothetical protein [Candidatus Diapherotrites archaeon]
VIISFFLISTLILSLFPKLTSAQIDPIETRYMRGDTETVDSTTYYKLLTGNTGTSAYNTAGWSSSSSPNGGFIRVRIYIYHANGSESLITTTDYIKVSGSTITLYSVDVNIPETPLEITDRIKLVWQWSKNAYTWCDFTQAKFITEQLGTDTLNSATWTIYIYAKFTSVWIAFLKQYSNTIYLYWGDSTYPSRIENFSYGGVPSEEWHNISLWSFNLTVKAWHNIEFWSFSLLTKAWHIVANWIFSLSTKAWNTITEWFFSLSTQIEKAWHNISYWILTLTTEKPFPFIILIGAGFLFVAIFLLLRREIF